VTDRGWGGPAAAPVVIDLGLMAHQPGAELEFEPRGSAPRPSPWLVVFVVLACCAAGLTAAGPPPPLPRLVLSLDRVIEAPRLVGDALIAYVDGDGVTGPAITTFGLSNGVVRWRHRPQRRATVTPAGPVTLLTPGACRSMEEFVTEAVDAGTGDVRWRQPGAPLWLTTDGELAVFKRPVTGCAEATGGFDGLPSVPFVWAGVELGSGAERWSLRVAAGDRLAVGIDDAGRASWLAQVAGATITAYDLRTGAVTGTTDLPAEPPAPAFVRVAGAGDRLLVTERSRAALTVHAYAMPALTKAWRTTVPPPGGNRLELDSFAVRGCGPVVCIGPATETAGLDAATGRERWRLPGRPLRVGTQYALLIRGRPGSGLPVLTVHNLATGVLRSELPETQLVGRTVGGVLLSIATGDEGRGLWRLDLGTGALQSLTALPRLYIDCESADRHLACRATDGSFSLWRLPARCPPECGAAPAPTPAARRRE